MNIIKKNDVANQVSFKYLFNLYFSKINDSILGIEEKDEQKIKIIKNEINEFNYEDREIEVDFSVFNRI